MLRDDYDWIPDPNKWEFPGGMQELGETLLETGIREIREEVNINLISPYFLVEDGKSGETIHNLYIEYLNDSQAQSAKKGSEGKDMGFFAYNDLYKLELKPQIEYLLKKHPGLVKDIMEGDPISIVKIKNRLKNALVKDGIISNNPLDKGSS